MVCLVSVRICLTIVWTITQNKKPMKRDMSPEELYSVIVDDVKAIVEEDIKTDERGRIILTEEMKNSLHKAQQSLEEGRCLNQEMFHRRIVK